MWYQMVRLGATRVRGAVSASLFPLLYCAYTQMAVLSTLSVLLPALEDLIALPPRPPSPPRPLPNMPPKNERLHHEEVSGLPFVIRKAKECGEGGLARRRTASPCPTLLGEKFSAFLLITPPTLS